MNILNLFAIVVCVAGISNGCGKIDPNATPTPEWTVAPGDTSAPSIIATATPVPTASATATPTPTATPTVTVHAFIYTNSVGICAALDVWNPATTTIQFPSNSGGSFLYIFQATGVYIANPDGSNPVPLGYGGGTVVITKTNISGTVCVITVTNGALISVVP